MVDHKWWWGGLVLKSTRWWRCHGKLVLLPPSAMPALSSTATATVAAVAAAAAAALGGSDDDNDDARRLVNFYPRSNRYACCHRWRCRSPSILPFVNEYYIKKYCRLKDDSTIVMQSVRRLLACTFVAIAVCRCIGAPPCSPDKLARYRVVVRTFWTRDRFPKHFPEWRPQAQWSKVVGKWF